LVDHVAAVGEVSASRVLCSRRPVAAPGLAAVASAADAPKSAESAESTALVTVATFNVCTMAWALLCHTTGGPS